MKTRTSLTLISTVRLDHRLRLLTSIRSRVTLRRQLRTIIQITPSIHSRLQAVPLPAKHIIRMRAVPRRVALAPDKRLAAIRGPFRRRKDARVPDVLEHDLRDLDRVRARAAAVGPGRVRDVRLVVCAVEVHAVPARGEEGCHADAARTVLRGEVGGIVGGDAHWVGVEVGARVAPERVGVACAGSACFGVPYDHAETLRTRKGLGLCTDFDFS